MSGRLFDAPMGEKGQFVRLIDIFFLGPFMLHQSSKMLTGFPRQVMMVAGLATIVYNLHNYLINTKENPPPLDLDIIDRIKGR